MAAYLPIKGDTVYVYDGVLRNISRDTNTDLDDNFGVISEINNGHYPINLNDGNTVNLSRSEFEAV